MLLYGQDVWSKQSYQQKAPVKHNCWKNGMCGIVSNLATNTSIGPKRNGVTYCRLISKSVIFGSSGHRNDPHELNSSLGTLGRQWSMVVQKNHHMEIFFILRCWSYLSYTRDHGSVWIHQNTWRDYVAVCWRGNAPEMGVSTRQRPQTQEASNILVPDKTDWGNGGASSIPQPQHHWKLVRWHKKCSFWSKTQKFTGTVECSLFILGWNTCF